MIHTFEVKILLILTVINNVNLCDDSHHLNGIFKTGQRAANVALAGDLVPAGTVLVTPGLHGSVNSTCGMVVCLIVGASPATTFAHIVWFVKKV